MKRGGPEGLRLVSSGRKPLSQLGHTLVISSDECVLVLREQRRVRRLKMIPDPRYSGHVPAVCIFHGGMMPSAPPRGPALADGICAGSTSPEKDRSLFVSRGWFSGGSSRVEVARWSGVGFWMGPGV